MYAAAAAFAAVAIATLLAGLFQEGLALILVSIGSSVAAAAFLVGSVLRRGGRPRDAEEPATPEEPSAG